MPLTCIRVSYRVTCEHLSPVQGLQSQTWYMHRLCKIAIIKKAKKTEFKFDTDSAPSYPTIKITNFDTDSAPSYPTIKLTNFDTDSVPSYPTSY